jgi:hypothetical protein
MWEIYRGMEFVGASLIGCNMFLASAKQEALVVT